MVRNPWYYYSRELDYYAEQLKQIDYAGIAQKQTRHRRATQGFFTFEIDSDVGPLTPESIKHLLSESAIGPPHGFDLLKPLPPPPFPKFPKRPETSPPIRNPQFGFSILGSPWHPPKHEIDPQVLSN